MIALFRTVVQEASRARAIHRYRTFLFTDIEGSTKLWEQHPGAMKVGVARHDAILRGVVEAHLGYVVKTTGDGFLAAFGTAHADVGAGRGMCGHIMRAP
jgi:class 3 adenylate cyclase